MGWKNLKRRIAYELMTLRNFKVLIPAEFKGRMIIIDGKPYSYKTMKRYADDIVYYCEQAGIYEECPVKKKFIPDKKAGKHAAYIIDPEKAVELAKKLDPNIIDEFETLKKIQEIKEKQSVTTIIKEDRKDEEAGTVEVVNDSFLVKEIMGLEKRVAELAELLGNMTKRLEKIQRSIEKIEKKAEKREEKPKRAEEKKCPPCPKCPKCPKIDEATVRLGEAVRELVARKPKEYMECVKKIVKGQELPDWCKLLVVILDNATEDTGHGDTVDYYIDVYNRLDSVAEAVENVKKEVKKLALRK